MIYCSFGPDSDVFVLTNIYGQYEIHAQDATVKMPTAKDAWLTLLTMKEAGVRVPKTVIRKIEEEYQALLAENPNE
jgi:hypothetical protein